MIMNFLRKQPSFSDNYSFPGRSLSSRMVRIHRLSTRHEALGLTDNNTSSSLAVVADAAPPDYKLIDPFSRPQLRSPTAAVQGHNTCLEY